MRFCICFVTSAPFPPQEGIGWHVYYISKELIRRGHKVIILTRGSLRRDVVEYFDGIEVHKIFFFPIYPFHIYLHGLFLKRIITKLEKVVDIFHLHVPLVPSIESKKPIITTFHSSLIEDIKFYEKKNLAIFLKKIVTKKIYKSILSSIIKKSKKIITVSENVKLELAKYFNIDKKEILTINNGVDPDIFKPTFMDKDKNSRKVLYVGRIEYRKGLFDLINSAEIVLNNQNDVEFILIGKGSLEREITNEIKKRGLEEKVKLLGHLWRDKLIYYYQNSDIFVCPSHYEGNPLVLLEAMSCGLPVITTEIGNGIVKEGVNGFMVPRGEYKTLANRIITLLENEIIRKKMAKEARETILSNFTWDIVTEKILKIYEEILK